MSLMNFKIIILLLNGFLSMLVTFEKEFMPIVTFNL